MLSKGSRWVPLSSVLTIIAIRVLVEGMDGLGLMAKGWRKDFWSRVEKHGPDECWPWRGTVKPTRGGYGQLSRGSGPSNLVLAHRYAYELTYGPIPEGLGVLHTCDNPPCCNPSHLYAGTEKQNAEDRERRGRGVPPKGERNGMAKLTWENVRAIRESIETPKVLAVRFGVTARNIRRVRSGVRWSESI